jgi:hypothetical protein
MDITVFLLSDHIPWVTVSLRISKTFNIPYGGKETVGSSGTFARSDK